MHYEWKLAFRKTSSTDIIGKLQLKEASFFRYSHHQSPEIFLMTYSFRLINGNRRDRALLSEGLTWLSKLERRSNRDERIDVVESGMRRKEENRKGGGRRRGRGGRASRRRDCVLMYGWHSDDNRDKLLY